MDKKIKIIIGYPWAGIPDDIDIIPINKDLSEEEISEIAYEYALDMIFNRIDFTWEEVE